MLLPAITIMLVTLQSGEQYGFEFKSAEDCGAAIQDAQDLAVRLDLPLLMVQCIETTAPSKSLRPHHRPASLTHNPTR